MWWRMQHCNYIHRGLPWEAFKFDRSFSCDLEGWRALGDMTTFQAMIDSEYWDCWLVIQHLYSPLTLCDGYLPCHNKFPADARSHSTSPSICLCYLSCFGFLGGGLSFDSIHFSSYSSLPPGFTTWLMRSSSGILLFLRDISMWFKQRQ